MKFLLALTLSASACVGTIESTGSGGGGSPDAPDAAIGGASGGSSGGGSPTQDGGSAAFACRNKIAAVGDGHHNAGQDCMNGCHNHGFSLAGTMFTAAGGNTPVVGASVTVVDAKGTTFDIVTQRNGNFYTSNTVTFPISVVGSGCPDVQHMTGTVTAGGCNKSGCHVAGAQGVIHLP